MISRDDRKHLSPAITVALAMLGCGLLILAAALLSGCDVEPAGPTFAKKEPAKQPAAIKASDSSSSTYALATASREPAKEPAVDDSGPMPAGIPRNALMYRSTIIRETRFYWQNTDMRPDVFFGQIHQESEFKATAKSAFASGLAQFTPPTAAGFQKSYPRDLQDLCTSPQGCPLDPHWAIRAGVIYDRDSYKVYGFAATPDDDWGFSLAAYNGGSGWIDRELKACTADPVCLHVRYFNNVQTMCGQSPPKSRSPESCKENQHYPNVILFKHRPLYTQWLGPLNNGVGGQ